MANPHPPRNGLYSQSVSVIEAGGEVTTPRCPVCDAVVARPRFQLPGFDPRLVVCSGCGLGSLLPMPGLDEIASFYPNHYYGDLGAKFLGVIEWVVRGVGRRQARFLLRTLPRGARVLDIGCGRGVLLSAFADEGFEAHGVERSEAAASGVDPRAAVRIAPRIAEAGYPDAHFDGVILWHVLEHLPDPRETLAEVHRILRPGGTLVVAVPNFSSFQSRWAGPAWFHLDLPRHLYHFSLDALRRLLSREGFQSDAEYHFSLRQNPFGWVQSFQNRQPGLPRNGLYTLLYERGPDQPRPFDAPTRRRLLAGAVLAAGPALVLSVAAAILRSGATVHVTARRVP